MPLGFGPIGRRAIMGHNENFFFQSLADPATVALVLTTFAPTVATPRTVHPASAALIITGFAPIIGVNITASPASASLVVTGYSPTVLTPRNIGVARPAAATLIITGYAPEITLTFLDDVHRYKARRPDEEFATPGGRSLDGESYVMAGLNVASGTPAARSQAEVLYIPRGWRDDSPATSSPTRVE